MELEVKRVDVHPLCPHCKKELPYIGKVEHGAIEQHVIYLCPLCHVVLSIGYDNYVGF